MAHKYVDLSQSDYGVALLNDSKYGYSVKNGNLSLNLLRSQNYPGEGADLGKHEFKYALYPHNGSLYDSDVEEISYNYNFPLVPGRSVSKLAPFMTFEKKNIMIETVKMCELSQDYIVRAYETKGVPTAVTATADKRFDSVTLTNMLEDEICNLSLENSKFTIDFKPFEVHTFRLSLSHV